MLIYVKKHKIAIASVALFAFAMISLIISSATSLNIKNNSIDNLENNLCTAVVTQVTIDSNSKVAVSNIDSACYGSYLTVGLVDSSNVYQIVDIGVINQPSVTSTSTIAAPATITNGVVFFNNFQANSQWQGYTVVTSGDPMTPANPSYSLTIVWSQPAATQFCADVTVNTTSVTPISWLANLDVLRPPSNGDTTFNHYQVTGGYALDGSLLTGSGIMKITGSGARATVSSSTPRTFQLCNYNAGTPSIDPNAVYTITETTPAGPSWYVCKTVTVNVSGTPWYVGWQAVINTDNLKSNYLGTGGSAKVSSGGIVITSSTANTITITGNGWGTSGVSATHPVSANICWGA